MTKNKLAKKDKPRGVNLHKLEVQAFLNGATQLRIPVKPQPMRIEWFEHQKGWLGSFGDDAGSFSNPHRMVKPPIQPGQTWFGREPFGYSWHHAQPAYFYRNDDGSSAVDTHPDFDGWIRARQMPFSASRIVRKCVSVRVERLQDASFTDCIVCGCESSYKEVNCRPDCPAGCDGEHRGEKWHYRSFLEAIHGEDLWQQNPWVWVVESESKQEGKLNVQN